MKAFRTSINIIQLKQLTMKFISLMFFIMEISCTMNLIIKLPLTMLI